MASHYYYTIEAVTELRSRVEQNINWYFDGAGPEVESVAKNPRRDAKIPYKNWAGRLTIDAEAAIHSDAANALIVFESLEDLSRHQASDERLWAYLCHNECKEYVAARWLSGYQPGNARAIDRIHNHFFVSGNRSLIRDNGISRLWWLGSIANHVDKDNPRKFLDILLYRQDVRSALIERPSVSMNMRVLTAIYQVMREDFETNGKALFQREAFREWMKNLNRRGGVILLDAVSEAELDTVIRNEAEQALAATT